jgi:hypothetical protein
MRKALSVLVLASVLCLLAGCGHTTYVQQRFPVLERPERPALASVPGSEMGKMSEEARKAVVGNFDALIAYVKKLEVAVDTYNEYAKKKNEVYGKEHE